MSSDEENLVEMKRQIAADNRDHRRLLFEEWRMNVQTAIDSAQDVQSLAAEYAQIGLKSAFLANAGALVALPPLMQWLSVAKRSAIPASAWWFVAGFGCAAVCSIISYANFMIIGSIYNSRAVTSATELMVQYGLREKLVFEEKNYKRNLLADKKRRPWVTLTMYAALATGITSFIFFFVGVFRFQNLVLLGGN
jgi:hypothetical protein